jgi:hypothetical protein
MHQFNMEMTNFGHPLVISIELQPAKVQNGKVKIESSNLLILICSWRYRLNQEVHRRTLGDCMQTRIPDGMSIDIGMVLKFCCSNMMCNVHINNDQAFQPYQLTFSSISYVVKHERNIE